MSKEENKRKAEALLRLKLILAQIKDCKMRGVAPPIGLVELASSLSNLFPDPKLAELFKEILIAEKELIQAISDQAKSSFMDIKDFKELIALDPLKAAEVYFEREEIRKLNNTINKIDKGELPPLEEFTDYIKILRDEKENREALCPALAVEVEKLKLESNEPGIGNKAEIQEKLDDAKVYQAKLGKHKVHAAVHNKYRDKRMEQGLDHSDEAIAKEDGYKIIADIFDINKMLEKTEILVQDIAAIPEVFVESFVKTKNTTLLKEQVESQKQANTQAAREARAKEMAEAAVREDVKEGKINLLDIKIEQEEVINNIVDVDKEIQKESKNQEELDKESKEAKKAALRAKKLAKESSMDMIKALKENAVGTGSSSVARSKSSGKIQSL